MNFRKLLNKETSFIVVSGGGATPLELDKVKWSKKLKDYWPKKNYKKIPYMNQILFLTQKTLKLNFLYYI